MKKLAFELALVATLILSISSVTAASLPVVGGSANSWGTILNDFLGISLGPNGTIKDNLITDSMIINSSNWNTAFGWGNHAVAGYALGSALTTETTARTNNDTTLQSQITANSGDISTLQTNLGTEATARTNADSALQDNITLEASTRSSADTGLQTNIDAKAPINSPTFTGIVAGITKAMVGLANVDNTADADKPVSTAQQAALDLKANLSSPTFTGTVTSDSFSGAGTGLTGTAAGLNIGGNAATATSAANADTVTNGVYTTGSYADPAWITSLAGSKLSGTVVSTNGVVTTGTYADPAWITSLAGSKITGDISGNAGSVTNGVYTTTDQTVGGTKTFSNTIVGNISGNAATVTNGVYTTGSYADPSWITSLAGSKISGAVATANSATTAATADTATNLVGSGSTSNAVDLATAEVAGVLPIANGGTGATTANDALNALLPNQTSNSGKILATDGTNAAWIVAGVGDMLKADNLSGLADYAIARSNLGLIIGTNVQAYDADLASIAALGTAADKIAYTTAANTWAETALTSAGRAILDDATASDQRTTLGLGGLSTLSAVGSTEITDGTIAKADVNTGFIKVGNLADDAGGNAAGWNPGASKTFTITADAASVGDNSVISVSLGNNTAASVCSVSTRTAATNFVVTCGTADAAPADGATLQYVIIN